jgi:hypothetical protein
MSALLASGCSAARPLFVYVKADMGINAIFNFMFYMELQIPVRGEPPPQKKRPTRGRFLVTSKFLIQSVAGIMKAEKYRASIPVSAEFPRDG